MRHILHSQESSVRVRKLAAVALSAILLSLPATAMAQETGSQGQDTQAQGSDSDGPGMRGDARMSRQTQRFIRLFDMNGDGKISIEEINADQSRMFTALDIDDDKKMSVDEIRRRGRSLQIFRTTTLFDLLDSDGDGYLSLVEVQAPSKRWFKRYDQNGDGVMDTTEIPGQRHWGRGGRR